MKLISLKNPILLVDDFSAMRRIVRILFQQIGCEEVIEADDGPSALEVLKNQQVSMIIADWTMPRMSGLELLRSIRDNQSTSAVPFLMMMTVEERQTAEAQVLENGGKIIIKPFIAEELGQIMHEMLGGPGMDAM